MSAKPDFNNLIDPTMCSYIMHFMQTRNTNITS